MICETKAQHFVDDRSLLGFSRIERTIGGVFVAQVLHYCPTFPKNETVVVDGRNLSGRVDLTLNGETLNYSNLLSVITLAYADFKCSPFLRFTSTIVWSMFRCLTVMRTARHGGLSVVKYSLRADILKVCWKNKSIIMNCHSLCKEWLSLQPTVLISYHLNSALPNAWSMDFVPQTRRVYYCISSNLYREV